MRSVFSITVLRAGALAIAALSIATIWPHGSRADTPDEPLARPIQVGVFDAPPFMLQREDGSWEGLSIDLWESVARRRSWEYSMRRFESIASLMKALRAGEVDVAPAVSSTPEFEIGLDLSHSYYSSGPGIALPASRSGLRWAGVVRHVISWDFLRPFLVLLLLWLSIGALLWLFEHRQNSAMFPKDPAAGVGSGVWWAAVTMTTVGYGDKVPRTLAGRVLGILWMLASIVLISSLTAALASRLTLEELSGDVRGVQDLPGLRVGAVEETRALGSLADRGLAPEPFLNEYDGLEALMASRLDAFIFDQLVLRYLARTDFAGRVRVLPNTFDQYFIKMAMPEGSPLREPLNRSMLEIVEEGDWKRQVRRYVGSDG